MALAAQHSLDVAGVFAALTRLPNIRRKLEASAGCALSSTQLQRLTVIVFLHDLGKVNRGFQEKAFNSLLRAGHVRELAPFFADAALQGRFAAAVSGETLCTWFEPPESALEFLVAAWSHHGKPQVFQDTQAANHPITAGYWEPRADHDPFQSITELMAVAMATWPAAFQPGGAPIPAAPALQQRFAGLVMLADWLGSHRGFFPLQDLTAPAPDRRPGDADRALRAVGLDVRDWQAHLADHPAGFRERSTDGR